MNHRSAPGIVRDSIVAYLTAADSASIAEICEAVTAKNRGQRKNRGQSGIISGPAEPYQLHSDANSYNLRGLHRPFAKLRRSRMHLRMRSSTAR
jgi:hypothetical protein